MTLLASGRRRRAWSPSYEIPTAPPYNVDQWQTFADPYGHDGSVVHPDILDFGTRWAGHRFWMAATPYYQNASSQENPSIWWSDTPDGWEEATDNPIYPAPPVRWNSDPEIAHDPSTNELIMLYRDGDFNPLMARSADGATWPAVPTAMTVPGRAEETVSPTLLLVDGIWHLWGIFHPSRVMQHWTAEAPEGPWVGPSACTGWNANIWHFNVVHDGDRFICLMHEGWTTGTAYAASSVDGLSWTKNPTPLLVTGRSGKWDDSELYRSAITLHENGTHVRVWYSGRGTGSDSWRLAYTEIPLSEWP